MTPTTNIIVNAGKNLKLSSEFKNKTKMSILITSVNIVLKTFPREIRKEKRNKRYRKENKALELSLFANDKTLYI